MSFTKKVVTTYAKSLFQNVNITKTSQEKKNNFGVNKLTSSIVDNFVPDIYIIGEELLLLRSILISSQKLGSFFQNPTYLEEQKLKILLNIFPGLTITTKAFLKVLTEKNHLSLIPEISDEYTKILLKFKNITNVKLIVASNLQTNSGSLLLKTLRELTGSKDIVLNVSFNPKLLGGLVLEYNSLAIDASTLKEFSLFFNEI